MARRATQLDKHGDISHPERPVSCQLALGNPSPTASSTSSHAKDWLPAAPPGPEIGSLTWENNPFDSTYDQNETVETNPNNTLVPTLDPSPLHIPTPNSHDDSAASSIQFYSSMVDDVNDGWSFSNQWHMSRGILGLPGAKEAAFEEDQLLESECMESEIKDLSDLHLRAYKATIAFSPATTCNDEMIEITSSLLRVIDRAVDCSNEQHGKHITDEQLLFLPSTPLSNCVDKVPKHPPNLTPLPGKSASGPNPATILMILSCCQRLFDLFNHVCRSLSKQLNQTAAQRHGTDGKYTGQYAGLQLDSYVSTAQVVMTIELLSHLVSRIDRGQHQLVESLTVDHGPTSNGSALSSFAPLCDSVDKTPPTTDGVTLDDNVSDDHTCAGSSVGDGEKARLGSVSTTKMGIWHEGMDLFLQSMLQNQESIHAQILHLKGLMNNLDTI